LAARLCRKLSFSSVEKVHIIYCWREIGFMPIVVFLPMHLCLVQWVGDKIEIVPGDSSFVIASAESDTYERTRCISGEVWEKDFLNVADYEIPPIQAVGSDEEF